MRMGRLLIGIVASTLMIAGCAAEPTEADEPVVAPLPVVGHVEPKTCVPNCPLPYEVRIASSIINNTGRPTFLVTPLIIDAIRAQLTAHPDIDVDEGNDPTNTNHALQVQGRLKQAGFVGTSFTVKCELIITTYPGISLVGNINKTLIGPDVSPRDTATQNYMISQCASVATNAFITSLTN
jgi:hypothetical protein